MRSRAIEAYKSQLRLSQEHHEVLVGLLLGDGCLETQNGGRTYRLKVEQSARHEGYVRHLHSLFAEWVRTPPRMRKTAASSGAICTKVTFQTLSHEAFRAYGQAFYAGRQKRVPERITRWLTARSLAYWFMDDGSMKSSASKGLILNTQAFEPGDVEKLVGILRRRFGLEARTRLQSDGTQIYISGKSFEDVLALISPYLSEDMRYKVPQPRRTQLPKR